MYYIAANSKLMENLTVKIKRKLQKLSFKTGVMILLSCIPFYIISFAQMLLPISIEAKSALWIIMFGLAKTLQYCGIIILGAEGIRTVKSWFMKKYQKK